MISNQRMGRISVLCNSKRFAWLKSNSNLGILKGETVWHIINQGTKLAQPPKLHDKAARMIYWGRCGYYALDIVEKLYSTPRMSILEWQRRDTFGLNKPRWLWNSTLKVGHNGCSGDRNRREISNRWEFQWKLKTV